MIGKQILNYEIKSLIGEGGMGNVYLGEHTSIGRKVAIKVLRPELSSNEEIRKRFKNEAKVMASLQHQGIVTLFDYHEDENGLYLIMEYVEGEELSDQINKLNQPMDIEHAKLIMKQVLEAFNYAHKNGIVHRDVKPANILVSKDGYVKVLDFGIAKIVGNEQFSLTKTGIQVGTAYYMSPEQVKASEIDHRSDIYSLGVTFYEMLAGYCPYKALTSEYEIYNKIVQEPLTSLVDAMGEQYAQVWKVIQKATAKDPKDRYASCEEMLKDLSQSATAAATKPSEKSAVTPSIQEEKKSNKSSKGILYVALAVVGVVLVYFVAKPLISGEEEMSQNGTEFNDEEEVQGPPTLSASASSTLANYKNFNFRPSNVLDGDLKTWWSPNKSSLPWVKVDLGGEYDLAGISIHAGSHYPRWTDGSDLYYKNYRIKRLRVEFSDGMYEYFDLKDVDQMQELKFATTRKTSFVKILPIRPYTTGKYGLGKAKWDDYCISEIDIIQQH